jgi:hypothetical protein
VGIALATRNLGRLAARDGHSDESKALIAEALDGFTALGSTTLAEETRTMGEALFGPGVVAAARAPS